MSRARRNQATLLKIIDLAYAAAGGGPRDWEPFLLALSDSVSARAAVLMHHDLIGHGSVTIGVRNDPEATQLYNEHYHAFDPRALSPRARALLAAGRAMPDDLLVPYADVERTSFNQDFALKFDISRAMCVSLGDDGDRISALSIVRAQRDGPFGPEELQWLDAVAPHAERALRIDRLAARAREERTSALSALDVLPAAILLVDRFARVLHANRAADGLLREDDGLRADRAGLRALSSEATAQLRALCAASADTARGAGLGAGGVVLLRRRSAKRDLQVLVSPIAPRGPFTLHDDRIAAIVFVTDPDRDVPANLDLLQALHGLTRAEAAVASRLAAGRTLQEAADALGYTLETMRWYSKQVLMKMGCRSRSDLVRQVSTSLAMLDLPRRSQESG